MRKKGKNRSYRREYLRARAEVESLTRVLDGSQLGFWDWDIATGEVRRNAQWAEMLGYRFEELEHTAQQWTDFVHPDDRARAWASIHAVLEGRAEEHQLTYRMRTKDGGYKWILDRARVVQQARDGRPLRMSGTHTDVDRLTKTKDALRESELRFRGIFENAAVGMAQFALDGGFLLVNDAFCTISGYGRAELLGEVPPGGPMTLETITHPDDREAQTHRNRDLLDGTRESFEQDTRYLRKDGTVAWVHMSVSLLRGADGAPAGLIGTAQDVTRLQALQRELEAQARTDWLTGIANRRGFMELAQREMERLARYGHGLAIVMLDIDHFKAVNDAHGHLGGDAALRQVSGLIKAQLRASDVFGRLGGEEFGILLPEADRTHALEVAERLRRTVAAADIHLADGGRIGVTLSLGLAVSTHPADGIDALLKAADGRLYQAKASGRNRVVAGD